MVEDPWIPVRRGIRRDGKDDPLLALTHDGGRQAADADDDDAKKEMKGVEKKQIEITGEMINRQSHEAVIFFSNMMFGCESVFVLV